MTTEKLGNFSFGGALSVLTLGALVAGCVPEFTDDVSQVEDFRVLAVRADPAEVAPGGQVSLSVLWAAPTGETVEVEDVSWGLCTQKKELTELGPVAPECLDEFTEQESETLLYLGTGSQVETTVARDVCRFFGPLAPPAEEGSTVSGRPADPDLSGGFYQPVLVGREAASVGSIRLLCGPSGLSVSELITFNRGYRPNEHPEFESIEMQVSGSSETIDSEQTLSVAAGEAIRLRATWPLCPEQPECGDGLCTAGENSTDCATDCATDPVGCTGAESYLLADIESRSTVTQREKLSLAWFTTAGTFETSVTDDPDDRGYTENVWTAPESPTTLTMWLVLRDDRGGVSWRAVQVNVE